MAVNGGRGQIVIHGKVDGGAWTKVFYKGTERADVLGGVHGNMIVGQSVFVKTDWEAEDAEAAGAEQEKKRLQEHNKAMESAFDKLEF
jgi:hypothetical protein